MNAMGKLIRILTAIMIAELVAPAPTRAAAPSITQEEGEKFVSSFYRDLEGDDLDKVMTYFDESVEYYTFGKKERAFVASELGRYFVLYPSRSLSVEALKLKPSTISDRVTVSFDLYSLLRNPGRDATNSDHAHMEWDLMKRDGTLKIVRFTGTSAERSPSASPSKPRR
jgi:hypothetical protein